MIRKCIVFDIDGTLFDTKMGIVNALNYVLNHFDLEKIKEEEQDKYIGPAIKNSLMVFMNRLQ